MDGPGARAARLARAINRTALGVSIALSLGIVALLVRDRAARPATPRWPAAGIVALAPESPAGPRERWIVAVNPGCPTCRERLARLGVALARRGSPPALGVLLVDVERRPEGLAGAASFAGGVWWDSAGTWRGRWRRRAYGEVLVFSPAGALVRFLPADSSAAPGSR